MDNPGLLTFCLFLTVMVMGTTQGLLREEWESGFQRSSVPSLGYSLSEHCGVLQFAYWVVE